MVSFDANKYKKILKIIRLDDGIINVNIYNIGDFHLEEEDMKKKNLFVGLLLASAVFSLAACTSKKPAKTDDKTTDVTPSTQSTPVTPTSDKPVTPTSSSTSADKSKSTSIATIKYNVEYNLDGGSQSNITLLNEVDEGSTFNITILAPIKTGYRFVNWKVGEQSYNGGDSITINSDITIVAQYVKTTPVQIYSNYFTGGTIKETVDANSSYEIKAPSFTRDHFSFVGYATTQTGLVEYEVGDTLNIGEEAVSLFAVWEAETIKINYKCLSMYAPDTEENVAYGATVSMRDIDFGTADVTFKGWSKEYFDGNSSDGFTVDYLPGQKVKVEDLNILDGTVTLYAIYVGKTHVYDSGTITKEATLEKDGKIKYECTTTGHTDSYEAVISKNSIFASYIDNAYEISGRGVVLTTTIMQGTINKADEISIVQADGTIVNATVEGIEIDRKEVNSATAGDEVGILIGTGFDKSSFDRGNLITIKGKEIVAKNALIRVYFKDKDEGGVLDNISSGQALDLLAVDSTNEISYLTTSVRISNIFDEEWNELSSALPGKYYYFEIEGIDSKALQVWIGSEICLYYRGNIVSVGTVRW